jgi:hypothetical protein
LHSMYSPATKTAILLNEANIAGPRGSIAMNCFFT